MELAFEGLEGGGEGREEGEVFGSLGLGVLGEEGGGFGGYFGLQGLGLFEGGGEGRVFGDHLHLGGTLLDRFEEELVTVVGYGLELGFSHQFCFERLAGGGELGDAEVGVQQGGVEAARGPVGPACCVQFG